AVDVAVGESDAEEGMQSLAVGDELIGDHHRLVGGDGEADADRPRLFALAGLARRGRGRVDSAGPTVAVAERTAGVARVDRGIGLDGIRDRQLLLRSGGVLADVLRRHRAVERGDDARGHGVGEAQRVAQSHDRIAHVELLRIAHLQRFDAVGTCSSSMMAMSVEGSRPTISASVVSPFFIVTAISPPGVSAGATTWLFVITCPWSS